MLRPISMPVKTRCRFTDYRKSVDSMILTIAVSSQNLKNGESYDGLIRCMALKWRSCYRQTGDIRNGYLLRKNFRNLIFRVYEGLLLFYFTDSRSFTVFIPAFASSSARLFMEVM